MSLHASGLSSHTSTYPQFGRGYRVATASLPRKMAAVALHMACLALFWVLVVSPVLKPLASGELAREFRPLLQALQDWRSPPPATPQR